MRTRHHHALWLLADHLAKFPHESACLNLNRLSACCKDLPEDAPGLALLHRARLTPPEECQTPPLKRPWGQSSKTPRTFAASVALIRRQNPDWLWTMVFAIGLQRGAARRHALRSYRRQGLQPDSIRLERFPIENAGLTAGSYLSLVTTDDPANLALLLWHDLLRGMDASEWRILFGQGLPRAPEWLHLAANRHGLILRWRGRFPWPKDDTDTWTRMLEFAAQGAPRRVLRFLLENGAVVTAQTLENALRRGRPDLMNLLESHATPETTLSHARLCAVAKYIRPNMARHFRRFLREEESLPQPVLYAHTAAGIRAVASARLKLYPRLLFHATRAAEIEAAIQARLPVSVQDEAGNTPLHWTRSSRVARALLRHGADPLSVNKAGVTAIRAAMTAKRLEVATEMVDALMCTATPERIQALLREWVIVVEDWESPAATLSNQDRLRLLRQAFSSESSPEITSVMNRWDELCEEAESMKQKALTARESLRVLTWHRRMLSLLQAAGADLNERDSEGRSLLQIAASGDHFHSITNLLACPESAGIRHADLWNNADWETRVLRYATGENFRLRVVSAVGDKDKPAADRLFYASVILHRVRWDIAGWRHWMAGATHLGDFAPVARRNPTFPNELSAALPMTHD